MNDKCGLVNQANPCRCARKANGFMRNGWLDANNLQFSKDRLPTVGMLPLTGWMNCNRSTGSTRKFTGCNLFWPDRTWRPNFAKSFRNRVSTRIEKIFTRTVTVDFSDCLFN